MIKIAVLFLNLVLSLMPCCLYTACGTYSDNTVITSDGEIWNYSTDAKENGEKVMVVFYDNNTDDIHDDVILYIK